MEILLNFYNDLVCREHIKANIKMLEIFSDQEDNKERIFQ